MKIGFIANNYFSPSCALKCHLPPLLLLTLSLSSSVCTHKNVQINLTHNIRGARFIARHNKQRIKKINILTAFFFIGKKITLWKYYLNRFKVCVCLCTWKTFNKVIKYTYWTNMLVNLVSNLLQPFHGILSDES